MNGLVHRSHTLGMAFTENVVDPRQLGSLELAGPLAGAGAACRAAGSRACAGGSTREAAAP